MMERFSRAVIRHRKAVVALFAALTLLSAACIGQVKVNGDFSDYLPPSTPSTVAINVMDDAFDSDVSNLRVYVQGIDLMQAKELSQTFAARSDVLASEWLGDNLDTSIPLETQNQDTLAKWRDAEGYLFQLTISASNTQEQIESIRADALDAAGATSCAVDGSAALNASIMDSVDKDMAIIMPLAVLVVLLVMAFATTSFLHPVIALAAIGAAIVMNIGSNIIQGEVSSVTQMVGAVLQLAVSMDYSIVLLTNYSHATREFTDPEEACVRAMTRSLPVVASSAAVTFFGFLSLTFMQFLIGRDMGIVLAKGIVLSFLSITLLMPCLLHMLRRPTAKLEHRPFLPSFSKFARACRAVAVPALVLAIAVAAPAFVAQDMTKFNYGSSKNIAETAQVKVDQQTIDGRFGEEQTWVIMVPQEQWGHENALVSKLEALPTTTSVTSYGTVAGSTTPLSLANESDVSALISGGYSRIVLASAIGEEDDTAYDLVEQVRNLCAEEYGDSYHLLGDTVSYYDIRDVATQDMVTVRVASLLAIALVLLIMFRSPSIPAILLFCIEVSIWINLSIPYFMDVSTSYIGFLVIDAVQLGAAVDYSIIFAHKYLRLRESDPGQTPAERARDAITGAAVPILTSSAILMLSTLGIYLFSSSPMVQELGMLICRGALIADLIIFTVMPTLFLLRDKLLGKMRGGGGRSDGASRVAGGWHAGGSGLRQHGKLAGASRAAGHGKLAKLSQRDGSPAKQHFIPKQFAQR